MTFTELALEVISSYVAEEEVPKEALADIINRSFEKFRSPGNDFGKQVPIQR
jgi:predicted transcriptional regulator